ncbi:MAG: hypothetical protein IJY39_05750 [Clostridia bacterium]|nr:hypothetical protein [Clostridia bacterium]
MNKLMRLIALLLTLVIAFSAFVACDGGKTEETTEKGDQALENNDQSGTVTETQAVETVVEDVPEVAKKNYGADYFIHIHGDVNPIDYYWVEESSNDVLSQALYDRQMKVSEHLGIEILGSRTLTEGKYLEPFKTAVKNKDGSVHTLLTHNYIGITSLVSENFLADLNTVSEINLEADYWNLDFMDSIAVKDHRYLGFSDFNILYTNVVSFNKGMMEKYASALDESLYTKVYNYRWTLDEMISLAKLVYVDATGDGKTGDDTFGISGLQAVPFVNFLHGCNINLVETNEKGEYVVSVYNTLNSQKTTTLVDKLLDLAKSDCSWFWAFGSSSTVPFVSDRVLMTVSSSYDLPYYLNYDLDFGVLPYPLYDEAQKDVGYRSLQWGGYITIPSYVDNLPMAAEALEMLAYYSKDVNLAFYEKLLGKQVADSPDDKKMLSIIWDGVCSDFGQTYYACMSQTNLLYVIPELTKANTSQNIASFMAKVDKSANKMIKKFIDEIK